MASYFPQHACSPCEMAPRRFAIFALKPFNLRGLGDRLSGVNIPVSHRYSMRPGAYFALRLCARRRQGHTKCTFDQARCVELNKPTLGPFGRFVLQNFQYTCLGNAVKSLLGLASVM
eukprot:9495807-Pyramimonas_sp.AAC.1